MNTTRKILAGGARRGAVALGWLTQSLWDCGNRRDARPAIRFFSKNNSRKAFALGCLGFAWLLPPATAAADDAPATLEYKVKAGYLFNFAKFVEWPATMLTDSNSPIVIGVMDGAEALPVIQQVLADKSVNGHPLQVKAVSAATPETGCHILLVTRVAGKSPEELRAALGRSATLLVGETERFAEKGGMIGLVREAESIRLTLNLEAAAGAGLKISSKLASVAKVVKGDAVP